MATKKQVSLMDFEGNPNIGIYMFANDKFCLLGPNVSETRKKEIEKTLNVPVYNITTLNTDLIGIFLTGNSEVIIAPKMPKHEKEEIEKICKKHKTKLIILNDLLNTFGNNICVGNKQIILGDEYSKETIEYLKTQTKYEVIQIQSSKFKCIGSTIKYVNNKYFISQEFTEKEIKPIIKEISGIGTVNKGSNFISSGIIGNKFGIIIGTMSSSVEIQTILENLNYI